MKDSINQSQIDSLIVKIPFKGETICMFSIIGFVGFIFLIFSFYGGILVIIIFIFYSLPYILISLYFALYKIEISRSNNFKEVNIKNIYGWSRIKANGNIHFYYKCPSYFIINDSNFDLSTENIKNKPARLFYLLKEPIGLKTFSKIKKKFDTNNYENPLLFDIGKYMGKKKEPLKSNFPILTNKFMKFGEHFFTYFLSSKLGEIDIEFNSIYVCLYVFYTPILSIGIFAFYVNVSESKLIAYIILAIIIMIPILFCLIFYCCIRCQFHEARIDFIYSKDFDRIFIGIVNYNQKKYSKTFEYQLDDIKRFSFELPDIINGDSILSIELKNKNIVQIQRFKFLAIFDQEGLEYILNKNLNNITSK